jgi:hypothetical protein
MFLCTLLLFICISTALYSPDVLPKALALLMSVALNIQDMYFIKES